MYSVILDLSNDEKHQESLKAAGSVNINKTSPYNNADQSLHHPKSQYLTLTTVITMSVHNRPKRLSYGNGDPKTREPSHSSRSTLVVLNVKRELIAVVQVLQPIV